MATPCGSSPGRTPIPPRPFHWAVYSITQRAGMIIGVTLTWAAAFIVLAVLHVGCLFYFDERAALPESELNRVMFAVVGVVAFAMMSLYLLFVGISHARAAEHFAGRQLRYSDFFRMKGAASPLFAYALSKTLALAPFGLFAAAAYQQREGSAGVVMLLMGVLTVVWSPTVAYLTIFATAAATETGPLRALARSARLAVRFPGGTWTSIGVVFLARVAENLTGNLATLLTAPYLSFAMVAKYRELAAQNLARG